LIIYVIEGLVFLLTGLQARTLIERAQSFSIRDLAIAVIVTTAIVIVARFVWVFPATYLPRWLSPSLRRRDPSPPWQWTFVLSFTGVRGVVSLAAALAIPLALENGQPFPNRDLILFCTFGVIILTLIGLGLLLPSVIRWLRLGHHRQEEHRREAEAEIAARIEALDAAVHKIDELAREHNLPDEVTALLQARDEIRRRESPKSVTDDTELAALGVKLRLKLIAAERERLHQLLREGKLTDESRRRIERELDLEEAMIEVGDGREVPL
jgi:CPA1 family monovalent cation:H+ antiporter